MISVIIAAYNSEKTIRRAILSVLAEKEVSEIFVVDDASTDNTALIARKCDDGTGRLRVVVHEKNMGPSVARNVAINKSISPWIAILDSDDFMMPGRMAKLLSYSDRYDFIADDILKVQENEENEKMSLLLGDSLSLPLEIGFSQFVLSNITKKKQVRSEMGFIKPIIRRNFLERQGLSYREDMRLGEDYELYSRALGLGAKMIIIPAQGYVSVIREGSISSNHTVHDLLMLRNSDVDLMNDLILKSTDRKAIEKHRLSIDCRLQWRLLILAIKRPDPLSVLGVFFHNPRVSIYLFLKLYEEVIRRLHW